MMILFLSPEPIAARRSLPEIYCIPTFISLKPEAKDEPEPEDAPEDAFPEEALPDEAVPEETLPEEALPEEALLLDAVLLETRLLEARLLEARSLEARSLETASLLPEPAVAVGMGVMGQALVSSSELSIMLSSMLETGEAEEQAVRIPKSTSMDASVAKKWFIFHSLKALRNHSGHYEGLT